MYIHTALNYKILEKSECSSVNPLEFMLVEVGHSATTNLRVLLAVIYRPPKKALLELFESVLQKHSCNYDRIIIMGDFNVDLNRANFESTYLQ
ncbi:hypothetical protein DD595_25290, partial [Enterobacter cloacae complex sp. 4DZ3-17B2]